MRPQEGRTEGAGASRDREPGQSGPGPGPPPQPPHLVLSTLGSKGQNRTTMLFTGRSTRFTLDAIFSPPSTTAPSSPRAGALGGGGCAGPPHGHLGTVVRTATLGAGGPRLPAPRASFNGPRCSVPGSFLAVEGLERADQPCQTILDCGLEGSLNFMSFQPPSLCRGTFRWSCCLKLHPACP